MVKTWLDAFIVIVISGQILLIQLTIYRQTERIRRAVDKLDLSG